MDLDRRSADRTLRLEAGSAVLEGLAAVGIVFTLFVVLVQSTVLLLAHQTAESMVVSEARRVALGATPRPLALAANLEDGVPGAAEADVSIDIERGIVRAVATITVVPPGPILGPVVLGVDGEVPLVVAP